MRKLNTLILNLEMLAFFRESKSVYDLHKASGRAYSNCWGKVQRLVKLGLIRQIGERHNRRNPRQSVKVYGLTTKGERLLELFNK